MSHDLTPPTPEPLDDAARARIRARVVAGTEDHRDRRAWLLPAAAAVTVLAVAAVTGYLTLGPDDDPTLGPAGSPGTSSASAPPTSTPSDPADALTVVPLPKGGVEIVVETLPDGTRVYKDATTGDVYGVGHPPPGFEFLDPDYVPQGAGDCRRETTQELPAARAATSFPSELGRTTFYVAGEQWALCDDSGGVATVQGPRPLIPDGGNPDFRVSSGLVTTDGGRDAAVFVAGGSVPEGATAAVISYRFPDGHVERATTQTDDDGRTWWRMEYTAVDGPLVDPDTNQLDLDPIQVSIDTEDGSQGFTLEWGTDTCAQVNHGC